MINNWRADVPIDTKVVWEPVGQARTRAGIKKRVTPRTLRNASAYYTTFQSSFILKTIGLGQGQSTAVYGRNGQLAPVPAQLASLDSVER
jgi:hypothetical protein